MSDAPSRILFVAPAEMRARLEALRPRLSTGYHAANLSDAVRAAVLRGLAVIEEQEARERAIVEAAGQETETAPESDT